MNKSALREWWISWNKQTHFLAKIGVFVILLGFLIWVVCFPFLVLVSMKLNSGEWTPEDDAFADQVFFWCDMGTKVGWIGVAPTFMGMALTWREHGNPHEQDAYEIGKQDKPKKKSDEES